LEISAFDKTRGKRFWSADDASDSAGRTPENAARGWIERSKGIEKLRVLILIEPFDNGAHVYLRLTFRSDRPYEVGVATSPHTDSKPPSHCILTATMGNYARLRELHLAKRIILPTDLWPEYRGNNFTPHARFPLPELTRTIDGGAMAIATPNERDPAKANYALGTNAHWRYRGKVASQIWRCASPDPSLAVQVNGRNVYWNSETPIPGGMSYENFEMVAPFQRDQEFWFGVEAAVED
jgi:hypothetical protein